MTSGPILLATLRGLVEAPLEIVAEVLLDVGPDGRSPIRPPGRISQIDSSDGIYRAIFDQAGSRVAVRVDSIAHTASIQGMWWYRANFTLTSNNGNCLVTQRIFNVAERLRWGVRFVARKPLAESRESFAAVLSAVQERLGCETYLLD